jgi:hypothetical protein
MADISDCGMSVIALGACSDRMATGSVKTFAETESAAERLAQRVRDSEPHFAMRLYSPQ